MFIDTHCHLEDENFSADRAEVLERAKVAGVEAIINFGSTMKSSIAVAALAKNDGINMGTWPTFALITGIIAENFLEGMI